MQKATTALFLLAAWLPPALDPAPLTVTIEVSSAKSFSGTFDPINAELYCWVIDRDSGKAIYEGPPGRSHPDWWFTFPTLPAGSRVRFVVRATEGDLSVLDTEDVDI